MAGQVQHLVRRRFRLSLLTLPRKCKHDETSSDDYKCHENNYETTTFPFRITRPFRTHVLCSSGSIINARWFSLWLRAGSILSLAVG